MGCQGGVEAFDAGQAAETSGKAGVSSLAVGMMTEGTTNRDNLTLSRELAQLGASLGQEPTPTPLGGLPEFKAAQARLDELMAEVQRTGAELKGFAPLLIDFPSELNGVSVLLCWIEGDRTLAHYHRADLGFAGRRPLAE